MFRNYCKIAWRNIIHNKGYAAINIPGLALGMACFILLTAYVQFEKSYDRSHSDAGNIYRVESKFSKNGQITDDWPTSTNGYATAMKEHFPEVASYARINWSNSERVVKYNNIKFREAHVCFADSNFFSFFSYPLLKGDPATVLKETNTIVISEAAAKKYFGSSDPMGKILEVTTQSDIYRCMVTGVFKDLPATSTMQFDMLLSWNTSPQWTRDFWYIHGSYTFVKLQPGINPSVIESKFPVLAEKYKTGDALKELEWGIELVPLADIHLNTAKQNEVEVKGNRRAVHFLSILAFVILGIACINYINLSTAKAVDRAREMGIRKISGARPAQVILQFLLESFLINALALMLAIVFVLLARSLLTQFVSGASSFGLLLNEELYFKTSVLFLTSVLLSGIYPAIIVLGMKPITVLKGKYFFSKQGLLMRKGLVIFQFIISLILITGTVAVYRQIVFMQNQALGVAIDQTLVMKAPVNTPGYSRKIGQLKNELLSLAAVKAVTGSGSVPGKEVGQNLANRKWSDDKSKDRLYEMLKVDFDFVNTYQIQVIAGRTFDKNRPSDSTGLVLNESAVKQFGFASTEKAIGEKILLETSNHPSEVIGVIKDYHQQSLQQKYTPLILFMDPAFGWIPSDFYSVKVKTGNIDNSIASIQKTWNSIFPESSFDFFFLDEYYGRQYKQEKSFGRVFFLFASLAIFIACMGLFGLTAFSTARRTKEIGVRKVLGASVQTIISLLSRDAVKLVLVSSVIALPLAYIFIGQWLMGYAFRVQITWWQFALPVIGLLLITILTIGFLTVKAAVANPVRALRSE